jgi:superfamily II DNA helicase RecQ
MQIQIFTIPVYGGKNEMDELNRFLSSHSVVEIEKHFVVAPEGAIWTFCVKYNIRDTNKEYIDRKEKEDYKQTLSKEAFERYEQMRKARKILADSAATPAYTVFYNSELANFAKLETQTLLGLKSLQGMSEARFEKFGQGFFDLYQKFIGASETRET